ncbi:hypothetical protein NZD89_24390 [Alicyclobacillus fastidiosus]|uniref:ATP-dependent DNA ligase family profile domain-containing protein n=1 Tax=Alicyclobacillus fastidiosus TaxID=392011 RepID=A0ABY6ZET8_9BACL|nr:hypothetical protein [Alicyclobacillus fastidiosus]WAH41352.1 hypothetical protein NZD89_24390 [Alicyclobacillus fastidiosus]GMA62962.1 hypothetical protein GCM10025859_34020 [Alicyclobacillus fastidiosus]
MVRRDVPIAMTLYKLHGYCVGPFIYFKQRIKNPVDCEGVCIRNGRSIFDDFQFRGRISDKRRIAQAVSTHPVTFVAFDVLFDGQDRTGLPLRERKKILTDILIPSDVIVPTIGVQGFCVRQEAEGLQVGELIQVGFCSYL